MKPYYCLLALLSALPAQAIEPAFNVTTYVCAFDTDQGTLGDFDLTDAAFLVNERLVDDLPEKVFVDDNRALYYETANDVLVFVPNTSIGDEYMRLDRVPSLAPGAKVHGDRCYGSEPCGVIPGISTHAKLLCKYFNDRIVVQVSKLKTDTTDLAQLASVKCGGPATPAGKLEERHGGPFDPHYLTQAFDCPPRVGIN